MNPDDQKLINVLYKQSYVSEDDVKKAAEHAKTSGSSLTSSLLTLGLINKPLLGQAIAESFELPFTNLETTQPSQEQVLKIPQDIARKHKIVLVNSDLNKVTIACANPKSENLLEDLRKVFPTQAITLTYGFAQDIEKSFVHYRDPLVVRLSNLLKNTTGFAPDLFEEVLREALIDRASDIHFEPQERDVVIRFRIDGVLHKVGNLLKPLYDSILNRVKILSHIRIDEHTKPQDGSIRINEKGIEADLRISIIPTLDGEKIAIRILSKYVDNFTLEKLGLSQRNQHLLLESIRKPFGMVLVTGPTGSGKTTTLYALIKILNNQDINITTIEDPVEYKIAGVNQIQVNLQTDLTFANGLKSIVRQDPNVILVGEIRDLETVEIAVNAALTGHLLFSTFHANDAATTIPRLLDMGAEPFLLSSTLDLIIAQRLVRRICNSCKYSQNYTKDYINQTFPTLAPYLRDENITLYRGKGCQNCSGTGYKGRSAIFEFIKISHRMKELIITHPSSGQIWALAKEEGSVSIFEDGFIKVNEGLITLEELFRVAQPA